MHQEGIFRSKATEWNPCVYATVVLNIILPNITSRPKVEDLILGIPYSQDSSTHGKTWG